MKVQSFLEHHGVVRNPFAEEDAQTDPVFKDHCIASTYHPTWDKIYGDPTEPATAIVFGEKGSGKTAMRLQIARHLDEYNRRHPTRRVLVVHYDDFNPFLDRFRDHLSRRRQQRADRVLSQWKLWDHMDALLTLAVSGLVDRVLGVAHPSPAVDLQLEPGDVDRLDRHQARDLLLLAACYDQSTAETFLGRWSRLARRLRFWTWPAQWDLALGAAWTTIALGLCLWMFVAGYGEWLRPLWLYLLLAGAGWIPWLWRWQKCFRRARRIVRSLRTGNLDRPSLRRVLMRFTAAQLAAQPLPEKDRTDDRYELLVKLQGILQTLGAPGIIVLVDRLDEPHLINGSADLMRGLLWPLLDNKLLKHPGLGFKLMLPIELAPFVDREDRDFYQRARLDKQNMIPSLEWTGQSLFDVAAARVRACAAPGATPSLRDWFEPSVSEPRLIDAMRSLRSPRRLFKFCYRLLVNHCNAHTDEAPAWRISGETFEATLALFLREQEAVDRGLAAG